MRPSRRKRPLSQSCLATKSPDDFSSRHDEDDNIRGRLTEAAKGNRHGHRDATMIFVAYRHGLRVSELTDLRWDQVEFSSATLHVRRVKQGTPSTHHILGDELRPCDGFSANRSQGPLSCSRQSAARRSRWLALLE